MLDIRIDIISDRIEQYGVRLLQENMEGVPGGINKGISGAIICLTELYLKTSNANYLERCQVLAGDLISYCRTMPVNDFSLLEGRGGEIYALLQLWEINADANLLQVCIDLIKPCIGEYLHSVYTSDYFVDGRAGTLLILLRLYVITQSPDLLEYIRQFSSRIIANAYLTDTGSSWKSTLELNVGNSCGFARGAAGIRYVLQQVYLVFPDPLLQFVIAQAECYIESCRNASLGNWENREKDIKGAETLNTYRLLDKRGFPGLYMPAFDLGWASGYAGVAGGLGEIPEEVPDLPADLSTDLMNGLAGIGCFYIQCYRQSRNEVWLKHINHICKKLLEENKSEMESGMFTGYWGVMYFLLLASDISGNCSIFLFPFQNEKLRPAADPLQMDIRLIFRKFFNQTIQLLDIAGTHLLNEYTKVLKLTPHAIGDFIQYISAIIQGISQVPLSAPLNDVLEFELQQFKFAMAENRTNLQIHLDQLLARDKAIDFLNQPDELISSSKLVISPAIRILKAQWEWPIDGPLKIADILCNQPQQHEYMFVSIGQGQLAAYSLAVDGLVLHRFDQPKTIRQAFKEVIYFFNSQSEEVLKEISKNTGSISTSDFLKRADFLVMHKIQQFIFDGILTVTGE